MPDTIFERQGIVMKAEQDFSVSEGEAEKKKKKEMKKTTMYRSREKMRQSGGCMRKARGRFTQL